MTKSKDKVTSLLAAIHRKVPDEIPSVEGKPDAATATKATPSRTPPVKTEPVNSRAKRITAKPSQFWFHDEHRQMIRELSAWLAGQGMRTSDSMVVRAALRIAKTGSVLLEAYRAETKLDGRIKHSKAVESE
jgi:hypothetical protein